MRRRSICESGQFDTKRRPAFGPILTNNFSLVLLNDAIADTETQTCALAHRPGCVERIENPLRVLYAGPFIRKLNHNQFVLEPGDYFQGSSRFGHGVKCVVGDVQAHLQ